MKVTSLKYHPALKSAISAVRELDRIDDIVRRRSHKELTSDEHYVINSALSFASVLECVNQLHFSLNALSGFRTSGRRQSMNRYEHITYAIENFYLRLTSTNDRCLRLVSTVYDYRLAANKCTTQRLIKMPQVKGTPVATSLSELSLLVDPNRGLRNEIAHRFTYSDSETRIFGMFYHLLTEDPTLATYAHAVKHRVDRYIMKQRSELGTLLKGVEDRIEFLFDSIHTPFEARLNRAHYPVRLPRTKTSTEKPRLA